MEEEPFHQDLTQSHPSVQVFRGVASRTVIMDQVAPTQGDDSQQQKNQAHKREMQHHHQNEACFLSCSFFLNSALSSLH